MYFFYCHELVNTRENSKVTHLSQFTGTKVHRNEIISVSYVFVFWKQITFVVCSSIVCMILNMQEKSQKEQTRYFRTKIKLLK